MILHVAAMPFSTPQGTQAAVREMVLEGHELLTYGRGERGAERFVVHRARAFGRADDFRSGPSLGKLVEDVAIAREVARISPDVIVAHHVEALFAARAVFRGPIVYIAHTAIGPELPSYFSRTFAGACRFLGAGVDRVALAIADATLAVSPLLGEMLGVPAAPLPWSSAPALDRDEARRVLGVRGPVAIYVGNLDAYQGIDVMLEAMDALPHVTLVVATASRSPLPPHVRRVVLDERTRALVHAAADVAVVPRRVPGGLPVKLLDALSRGVPVVAPRRAAAGLEAPIHVVSDDDPRALSAGIAHVLGDETLRHSLSKRGPSYVRSAHSTAAFAAALLSAIDQAKARRAATTRRSSVVRAANSSSVSHASASCSADRLTSPAIHSAR